MAAPVRIIHLSDLHLFLDSDGTRRRPEEAHRAVRFLQRVGKLVGGSLAELVKGFRPHDEDAWEALLLTLDELIAERPVVVIQSGDIATYGGTMVDGEWRFPEVQFWQSRIRRDRTPSCVAWMDLFGNHDVWPATMPLLGRFRTRGVTSALRRDHFPERLPDGPVRIPLDSARIEIHRINTVCHGPIVNFAALGDIDTDLPERGPYEKSGSEDPLDELSALAERDDDVPVIRIVVAHHPPHFFEVVGKRSNPLTEGVLTRSRELGIWLEQQRTNGSPFHVVIAGHRHALDPAREWRPPQHPLPPEAVQLVCSSPTQEVDEGEALPSFSVYDLAFTDPVVDVRRTIYERRGAFDTRFVPGATLDLELAL